jgi:hypothetical protein
MIWLFLRPTILETRQCILIGLPVSVGVPLSDVCVRNETSNARKGGTKENQNNLNESYIAITSLGRYFGFCLPACGARLSETREREREKVKYRFISIMTAERRKF